MAKQKNHHLGRSVQEHISELRQTRPGFREAFDKLRLARIAELVSQPSKGASVQAKRVHTPTPASRRQRAT